MSQINKHFIYKRWLAHTLFKMLLYSLTLPQIMSQTAIYQSDEHTEVKYLSHRFSEGSLIAIFELASIK